jgi:hypothetical protein
MGGERLVAPVLMLLANQRLLAGVEPLAARYLAEQAAPTRL